MKITIVGYGYVGKAYSTLLAYYHEVEVFDPKKEMWGGHNPDAVIVCVNTPSREDGSCDFSNIQSAIVKYKTCGVPILIKSTLSLDAWNYLNNQYHGVRLSFSPEFLRAETAIEDVMSASNILVGGPDNDFWREVFSMKQVVTGDPKELIIAKYARNAFLAMKVTFFNQLFDYCEENDVNFGYARLYTCMDKRIGSSHSYVTAERGYGGHCLPKDVNSLLFESEMPILESIKKYNNFIKK